MPPSFWTDDAPFVFGESARYSGLPTRNASCCGGVALRMSSQNLSRWPCSFSMLISTRLYRSARHQERASLISAAQSTSRPSLLIVSARSSRLLVEVSRNVKGTLNRRLLIFSIAKAQSALLVCLRG